MGRTTARRSADDDALELARHAAARFGRPDHEIPADVVTASAFAGVADLADLHRLSGCIGAGLEGIDGVPDEVRSRLASAHRLAAVRHLVALRALGPIARRFDEVGIRWLVMKGPVLAAHLYRDVGTRAYGDIDLLIHPEDLAVAVGLLEELGYEHVTHNWPLARWYRASEFAMRSGSIELDVHWHVLYAWYDREDVTIDLDAMFERVRRVNVGGLAVPTFDEVDTLVMLGLHASKSGTHRLVWLKDIERALAVDRPCLQEVVRRSHEWRVAPRVGVPLARSVSLLAAEVPVEVIEALLPRPLRAVDRAIVAISPPVRADEADTLARWWSRSLRSSGPATAWGLVDRTHRAARRLVGRWPGDESSDELEKRRYLDEVAATGFDRARIRADAPMSHRVERIRRANVGDVAAALAADEPRDVGGAVPSSRAVAGSVVGCSQCRRFARIRRCLAMAQRRRVDRGGVPGRPGAPPRSQRALVDQSPARCAHRHRG